MLILRHHGSVAQLVEQGIHKPRVTGSNPVAATVLLAYTLRTVLEEPSVADDPTTYVATLMQRIMAQATSALEASGLWRPEQRLASWANRLSNTET